MVGWEVRLIDKIERAEGTVSFRFNRPPDLDYLPGQYFFISIPKDGRRLMHHFSFSSSPSEAGHIEFTTRIRDSEFKQKMVNLPSGTKIQITEVHGEFTVKEDMRKVAFVCGGIGITAAISNIRWAAETKATLDIVLLYANRNLSGTAFREDLEKISNQKLRVVHILSKPDEGWKGTTGHIDAEFVKAQVPDWKERFFFVSGPPAMVEAIVKVLKDGVGVDGGMIKTENYLGY
jgi:ferredoxin-NADP reductase